MIMKNIFFFFLAFFYLGICAQALTLKSPQTDYLSNSSVTLIWQEDILRLESWELSFTMSNSYFGYMPQGTFFQTYMNSSRGLQFNGNNEGFHISHNGTIESMDASWFATANKASVTISFISSYDPVAEKNIGGTFSFFMQDESNPDNVTSLSFNIADEAMLKYCYLNKKATTSFDNSGYPVIDTCYNCKYTNIKLSHLDNAIIPKPTTATLSILSLIPFVLRRRRK